MPQAIRYKEQRVRILLQAAHHVESALAVVRPRMVVGDPAKEEAWVGLESDSVEVVLESALYAIKQALELPVAGKVYGDYSGLRSTID